MFYIGSRLLCVRRNEYYFSILLNVFIFIYNGNYNFYSNEEEELEEESIDESLFRRVAYKGKN